MLQSYDGQRDFVSLVKRSRAAQAGIWATSSRRYTGCACSGGTALARPSWAASSAISLARGRKSLYRALNCAPSDSSRSR